MYRFPTFALALGLFLLALVPARADNCPGYPFTLVNGTPNDANKVMADFNSILNCANTGLADAPVNDNITRITGLTTPLSLPQGGTGTALARTPALSGANSDITSLSGLTTPLSVAQGGTGTTTGNPLVPTGAVFFFAGSTLPSGYTRGNGGAVSRTGANAALFAVIGTTYGVGDGSTTFNLPDCRARYIAGLDPTDATGRMTASTAQGVDAAALGNTGGEQAHSQTIGELAIHSHTITDPGHRHNYGTSNGALAGTGTGSASAGTDFHTDTQTTGITVNTTGLSLAANILGPTIVMNCIIKQ